MTWNIFSWNKTFQTVLLASFLKLKSAIGGKTCCFYLFFAHREHEFTWVLACFSAKRAEPCKNLHSTSSWFRCVSNIPIMSWNLMAVSSLTICSFGSFLENPRRLNEQIRKDERLSILVRILQVVSVPNFWFKVSPWSETLAGADSTWIARLVANHTLH